MSKTTTTALIAGIAIIFVLVVGLGLMKANKTTQTPNASPSTEVMTESASPSSSDASMSGSPSDAMAQNTVTISANGFSPQTITIKAGDTVTWVNSDQALHQVNSDPHPTHTAYPPLNTVAQIPAGQQKSLTFPTAGKYGYHDHLDPSLRGTVVVE